VTGSTRSRPSAAGVHERVVVDPAVPTPAVGAQAGDWELGGERDRGSAPVGRSHHQVDPSPEGVEPGETAPPGDQRASPSVRERATAAAEMPFIGPRLTTPRT
jgi:hypothetical protein